MVIPTAPVIIIVDDDFAVSAALQACLAAADWSIEAYDSANALLGSAVADRPGCVLMSVHLPDLDAFTAHERLTASGCEMPVIYVAACADIRTSVRAIKAGAFDFLTKPIGESELVAAVRRALAADQAQRWQRSARNALARRISTLTPRERQVLELVVTGMLNKQIAGTLGAALKTIKVHRARVMAKMQVESLAELVRVADQFGIGAVGRFSPNHALPLAPT